MSAAALVVVPLAGRAESSRAEAGPNAVPAVPVAGWGVYAGDPGGSRHSPLTQIRPDNVRQLELAWEYHTGDYPGGRLPGASSTTFQATPILDDGTLYFCSPVSRAFALDAETGAERWIFDAEAQALGNWTNTCRGVALWKAGPMAAAADSDSDSESDSGSKSDSGSDAGDSEGATGCAKRIFMGTNDAGLVALDAETGRACEQFGVSGRVDLRTGLGDVRRGETFMTSPPTVVGDVVVTGALVADNRRVNAPGGVIRGFDARTGELRWAFDPVPPGTEPLEPSADGSPRYHRGTPNAWSILSADLEAGLVFVPFGNPSPDFYGGHREGFDYYGSSVVALDAATGAVVWRFQTVHHDLWDYDIASQPVLLDVHKEGQVIPAVAQATKMGHVFLLDRRTGEPIYPVEERPVPQTDIPGETSSPTQPFPTFPEPLHPHQLRPEDAFGFTAWDRGACERKIRELRNEGIFTPPSLRGTVQYPGVAGGVNWGSVAVDPDRRLLVMAMNRIAVTQQLIPDDEVPEAWREQAPQGLMWQEGTPYRVKQTVLLSPLGVPCSPPPWGTLLAVDLETGKKRWEIPFGTVRDMLPIPLPPLRFAMGLPHMGGPLVTASGLVFIGASLDNYIRAYDSATGAELWRERLPAGGQATPMTYRLRPGGKQYVVIAAGGHSAMETKLGDSVMAFALRD